MASLEKNAELFPAAYRYYSAVEGAVVKRMTAFHFGEMSSSEWRRMPDPAKFGWYYDKTHSFIALYKDCFAETLDVFTETLDEEANRRALARIAVGSEAVVPLPEHLNFHTIDMASILDEDRDRAMWLLGRLNLHALLTDDVYGINYFLNKFVARTGYQIRGQLEQLARSKRQSASETAATLARAREILQNALRSVGELEQLNRARED